MTFIEDEKRNIRIEAHEIFNNMTFDTRCKTIPLNIITQIQELEMQKKEVNLLITHINNRINTLYTLASKELKELANKTIIGE